MNAENADQIIARYRSGTLPWKPANYTPALSRAATAAGRGLIDFTLHLR
jgi:hypothetical protein